MSVEARLRERQEALKVSLEKKRAEREEGQRVEETADYFEQDFAEKKSAITKLLESSEAISRDQLSAHFDGLSLECQALQKYVSDSVIFLTAHSLRHHQQQIAQLQQELTTKQDQLMPKKKFAFKSRKKEASNAASQSSKVKRDPDSSKVVSALSQQSLVGFRDRAHEKLVMSETEVKSCDLNLSGLSHCEVRLYGAPSTLHMSRLDNCTSRITTNQEQDWILQPLLYKVLCGPVSSSVFIDDCIDCVFVVACQQLRVHTTTQSKLYVHVTSRSIIEDCSKVTFAPYNWTYSEIAQHFKVSGLDQGTNNWEMVDDFNWLASSDHSPNWSTLPEQERTVFNDIVVD